jgi:hypothetical protein
MIDLNDDDENKPDSMRRNSEFASNRIDEIDRHDEKHPEQRISTFRGIMIAFNDE